MILSITKLIAGRVFHVVKAAEEDKEVFMYGLELIISTIVSLSFVITIGIVFNNVINIIAYLTAFCIMRIFAGGYHAKSHLSCTAIFVVLPFSFVIFSGISGGFSNSVMLVMLLFSGLIILLWAPDGAITNPLCTLSKEVMRKYSIGGYITFSIIIILLCTINKGIGAFLNYGIFCSSILVLTGRIQKKILEVKINEKY